MPIFMQAAETKSVRVESERECGRRSAARDRAAARRCAAPWPPCQSGTASLSYPTPLRCIPYKFDSVEELLGMTRLARFYVALPVLSRSLHNAFLQSPDFINEMAVNAPELLLAARELRHAELFKDCLLLCLGPWVLSLFTKIEDRELWILAEKYSSRWALM